MNITGLYKQQHVQAAKRGKKSGKKYHVKQISLGTNKTIQIYIY